MIERDPKSGFLCRRVRYHEPVTIRHGGEDIRVLALPTTWDEPFVVSHRGEDLRFHIRPSRRRDGTYKGPVYTMVFIGPKTFRIVQEGHGDREIIDAPSGATDGAPT